LHSNNHLLYFLQASSNNRSRERERERERERVMAKPHVTMEVGNDGVAVVTLINPPVNALAIPSKYHLLPLSVLTINLRFFFVIDCVEFDGDAVIAGLKEKFDEATRRNDVKALVLTGNLFYNTD